VQDNGPVEIETFDIQEIGPYIGQRIAGTSNDVANATLSKEYRFADGIVIRVVDIPARLDRATGRTYISAHDGKILMNIIQHYADVLRQQRTRDAARLRHAPIRAHLRATQLLTA
jgi:hypothetical protein